MGTLRIVVLLAGAGLFWLVLRSVVKSWLGGPGREEMLRQIGREERDLERANPGETPVCPVCGAPTAVHAYPHITVWRCTGYPACRGFVKVKKPVRMRFAEDWDRKRGGGS